MHAKVNLKNQLKLKTKVSVRILKNKPIESIVGVLCILYYCKKKKRKKVNQN